MPNSSIQPESVCFPRALKCVLFDMDGVLIHSGRAWLRVVQRTAEALGCSPPEEAVFWRTFGQGLEADRALFFPGCSVGKISAHYEAFFAEELEAVEVAPGASALLEALSQAGVRCAVVTNSPWRLARRILEEKELAHFFGALAGEGEAAEKPSPALLLLALERLSEEPSGAIFVGDARTDREAAAAAGVFFVGLGLEAQGGGWSVSGLEDLQVRLGLG